MSPSGRYTISGTGQLSNIQAGSVVELPTPDFGFDQNSRLIKAQWDASEEWVLLGYNIWSSSGVDGVSIVGSDGRNYRELTTCGFAPACVGWLPENVDVAQIPSADSE